MFTPRVSGKNYLRKSAKSAGGYLDATGNVMCIYTRHGDTLTAGERPIYGTKRLGELRQQIILGTNGSLLRYDNATIGTRHYELTDHLGNVMAVVSDRKTLSTDSVYYPVVITATDYYPFGYPIPDRSSALGGYRYGFNGQEKDNEIYGEGKSYSFEFRNYDARLGRFWSVDPLSAKFPWNSAYAFAENRVIDGKELEGLESVTPNSNIIAVDPGHGIDGARNPQVDPGAVGNGYLEKDIVLKIAKSINDNLSSWGTKTVMTRTGDITVKQEQITYRIDIADDNDANIFVSIHTNASENPGASGFLVLFNPKNDNGNNSQMLAESIVNEQSTMQKNGNGYQQRYNLGVLNMFQGNASVLIEVGFISNSGDVLLMTQNAEQIGKEIAIGVFKYLYGTEPETDYQNLDISPQKFILEQITLPKDNLDLKNNPMGGW